MEYPRLVKVVMKNGKDGIISEFLPDVARHMIASGRATAYEGTEPETAEKVETAAINRTAQTAAHKRYQPRQTR